MNLSEAESSVLQAASMKPPFPIVIPFNVYSASAVSAARRYIRLMEGQLSQAHEDAVSSALEEYHNVTDPDHSDYDIVRYVDLDYEDEFRPILRLSSIVYLYMVFETYVLRHITAIQSFRKDETEIVNTIKRGLKKRNEKGGLVRVAQIYFKDHVKLEFFTDDQWEQLSEIEKVRHCIVHNAGIPFNSQYREIIYLLETTRQWQNQRVGLEIERCQNRDLGRQMIVHQRFLEYCLSVLEQFFHALGIAADARFRK